MKLKPSSHPADPAARISNYAAKQGQRGGLHFAGVVLGSAHLVSQLKVCRERNNQLIAPALAMPAQADHARAR
jgi:hypothetical protein